MLYNCLVVPLLLLLLSNSIIPSSASTARTQQSLSAGLKVELRDVRAANVQKYKWRVGTEADKPVATFELSSTDALPGTVQKQIRYVTDLQDRVPKQLLHLVLSWLKQLTVVAECTACCLQLLAQLQLACLISFDPAHDSDGASVYAANNAKLSLLM